MNGKRACAFTLRSFNGSGSQAVLRNAPAFVEEKKDGFSLLCEAEDESGVARKVALDFCGNRLCYEGESSGQKFLMSFCEDRETAGFAEGEVNFSFSIRTERLSAVYGGRGISLEVVYYLNTSFGFAEEERSRVNALIIFNGD